MNRFFIVLAFLLVTQPFVVSKSFAGDFDWLSSLNIEARSDMSGFQVNLATRFHIGGAEINTVIRSTDRPADAYMVFRLSELSHRPVSEVLRVYRPRV